MKLSLMSTWTCSVLMAGAALVGCSHPMHDRHHLMGDLAPLAMVAVGKDGQVKVLDANGKEIPPTALAERVTKIPDGSDPTQFDIFKLSRLDGGQKSSSSEEPPPILKKVGFLQVQSTPCTGYMYFNGKKYGVPAGCAP